MRAGFARMAWAAVLAVLASCAASLGSAALVGQELATAQEIDFATGVRSAARLLATEPAALRRFLGGDYSQINSILGKISLDLDIGSLDSIYLKDAKCFELLGDDCFASVHLTFYFRQPKAKCNALSIGNIEVTGRRTGDFQEFWPDWYDEDDRENRPGTMKEEFHLDLLLRTLGLTCKLPMQAENSFNNGDLIDDPNPAPDDGELTIMITDLNVDFRSVLYSGLNFTLLPPHMGFGEEDGPNPTIVDCASVVRFAPGGFEFVVTGLTPVTIDIPIIGVVTIDDLSTSVTEELNGEKSSIALDPVQEVLCELRSNVTKAIAQVITELPWSNQTDPTYLIQPQGEDRASRALALKLEESFSPPETVLLSDLGDNVLVNLVDAFPGDSVYISGDDPEVSIFTDIFDFLLDVELDNSTDPILAVLDLLLNSTTLYEDKGVVVNLDALKLVEDVFGNSTVVAEEGFKAGFELALQQDARGKDVTALLVNITLRNVLVSITPRDDAPTFDRFWLDRIQLLGKQTLLIPEISGFDIGVTFDLEVLVEFMGGATLIAPDADPTDVLTQALLTMDPFTLPLERLAFTAEWRNFFFEGAANIAIDENAVTALPVGPLAGNLVDCLMSTFYVTPRLTEGVLNSAGASLTVSGAADGLIVLVQEAVNTILPLFVGLIPGLIEEVARENFVNVELIEPFSCPAPVADREFFSFEGDLMDTVQDLLTESTVSTILDLVFPKDKAGPSEGWNQVLSEPVEVFVFEDLPSGGGLNVTLELLISKVELRGLSPANFTAFRLFEVNETSGYGTEGLVNELGLGVEQNPVRLAIELEINTYPDRSFTLERRRQLAREQAAAAEYVDPSEGEWYRNQRGLWGSVEGPSVLSEDDRELQEATDRPTVAPTFPLPTRSPTTARPSKSPTTLPPTPFPKGTQLNRVRLDASFVNVYAYADLWLKFFEMDVISTQLGDVLELWCWMGKLQPYGGLKAVKLLFVNGLMRFECIQCMNDVLQGLSERFNNDAASDEFFKLVNELLDYASTILIDFFEKEAWNTTISDMQRWCAGEDSLPSDQVFERLTEDLSATYAFLGMSTVAMGLIATANCCCISSTHVKDNHRRIAALDDEDDEDAKRKVADLAFLEQIDNADHVAHELEHTPLFNHACVPVFWRFMVPFLLVANLALFIMGHVGVAITTSLLASVAGVPIGLEDFQSISVIQSASAVWNAGGYFLALLIIILSICWPYIKIVGMTAAWFLPTKVLSFHRRGALIRRLDQLGKLSLVELYLVLFILVTFRLNVKSPETTFLPPGFYYLELLIDPQLSLYTFCTALVISLATSNVIEWYHEAVEKRVATVNREAQKSDQVAQSIIEYAFPAGNGSYTLGISKGGVVLLIVGLIMSIIMILAAAATPVLRTEVLGLARLVIDLEGKETVQEYSLFRFLTIILGGISVGEIYLGAFFMLTVVVIPVLQIILLVAMLVGRFTLDRAILVYDINVVLSAWCCSEVFALGVAVTSLELGSISGNLVYKECAFLAPIMENQLRAIDLVDEQDVSATCFQLLGTLGIGMYVLLGGIVISNICHFFVTVAFLKCIQARLDIREGERKSGPAINWLERILVKLWCMWRGESASDTVAV